MATRMATLLDSDGVFGEDGDAGVLKTKPLPIYAPASRPTSGASTTADLQRRREQITLPESPSPVRSSIEATYDDEPRASRDLVRAPNAEVIPRGSAPNPASDNALPSLGIGIFLAAAIWVGFAMVLFGLVYPMSFFAHVVIVTVGAWITAAGVTYAFASRPQTVV